MPEYTLYYFDVRNLAEPIRLLLHYKDVKFEDVRFNFEEWQSVKKSMPQGTLPVLKVGNQKICQSHAIMRYLGRIYQLTGKTNLERAKVDSIADLLKDSYQQTAPWFYIRIGFKTGDLDEAREQHFIPMIQNKLPIFVAYLKEAKSGYYVKSGLTYVDFICSEYFDSLRTLEPSAFKDFPEITAHVDRIHSLPELSSYISNRK